MGICHGHLSWAFVMGNFFEICSFLKIFSSLIQDQQLSYY